MAKGKGRIVIRGDSIFLDFYLKGRRYRPTLTYLSASNKANLKAAELKLNQIQADITLGTFSFAKHFPNNPQAKFDRSGSDILIKDRLEEWLRIRGRDLSPTTIRGYTSSVYHHLIPRFGHLYLSDLRAVDIKEWIYELQLSITNKTIKNHQIPLREIFLEAYQDELIDSNPLEKIKPLSIERKIITPFNTNDMWAVINACEGQIKNMIIFAFFTGARTGEYIALKWNDIDLKNGTAYIHETRNRSGNKSTPKTRSSIRQITLLQPVRDALIDQKNYTELGDVFLNPFTGKPWKDDSPVRKRAWIPALKKAGIPYVKPYVTRHTFASNMLSSGRPPMWVVQQMGHTDLSQIISTYAKWIPREEDQLDVELSHLYRHRKDTT